MGFFKYVCLNIFLSSDCFVSHFGKFLSHTFWVTSKVIGLFEKYLWLSDFFFLKKNFLCLFEFNEILMKLEKLWGTHIKAIGKSHGPRAF